MMQVTRITTAILRMNVSSFWDFVCLEIATGLAHAVVVTEFTCAAADKSEKQFPCSLSCSPSGSYTLPTSSMIPESRGLKILYGWLLFK